MSDIRSTLYIDDEFSDTLSELTIQAFKASKTTRALTKATEELSDSYDELSTSITDAQREQADFIAQGKLFDDAFKLVEKTFKKVAGSIKFEFVALQATIENKLERHSELIKKEILLRKEMFLSTIKYEKELAQLQIAKANQVLMAKKKAAFEMLSTGKKLALTGIGKAAGFVAGMYYNDNKIGTVLVGAKKAKEFALAEFQTLKSSIPLLKEKAITQLEGLKKAATLIKQNKLTELSAIKDGLIERIKSSKIIRTLSDFKSTEMLRYGEYVTDMMNRNSMLLTQAGKMRQKALALHATGRAVERRLGGFFGKKLSHFFHAPANKVAARHNELLGKIQDPSGFGFVKQEVERYGKLLSEKTKNGLARGFAWLNGTEVGKMVRNFAFDMTKLLSVALIQNIAFSLLKKFKDELISIVKAADAAIANSLDRHILSDKYSTLYGERGGNANQRASIIANKLGLNDETIKQLGLSAASSRIGTDEFERILQLSDKIAKLSPGETTESIAQSLISSMAGERDAGTLASLLGGSKSIKEQLANAGLSVNYDPDNQIKVKNQLKDGFKDVFLNADTKNTLASKFLKAVNPLSETDKIIGRGQSLEQQLVGSGYEAALSEGDLSKALDIAEKITEQAGFTDKKYKDITNTMSQNYQEIHSNIDNIKKALGEIYTKELEPAVKRVKEFMESPQFQKIINYIAAGIRIIGRTVNKIINALVDSIDVIEKSAMIGIIAKLYLTFRSIQAIVGFIPLIKTALVWILNVLGFKGIAGKLASLTIATIKEIVLQKLLVKEELKRDAVTGRILWKESKIKLNAQAIAGLKLAGAWVAAAAAIGLCLYLVYKLSGETKSFGGYLKGIVAVIPVAIMNGFQSLIITLGSLWPNINKQMLYYFGYGMETLIGNTKKRFGELISWVYEKLAKASKAIGADALAEGQLMIANEAKGWGSESLTRASHYEKEIATLNRQFNGFISDIRELGFEIRDAYQTEGESVIKSLEELIGVEDLKEKGVGIITDLLKKMGIDLGDNEDNTYNMASSMNQDEDLRWLKAFSDRQITSSYDYSTSQTQTINLNGLSEQARMEGLRRNRSTISQRAPR